MQKSIGFRGVFQEGLSPTYGGRSTVRLIIDTGLPPHSSEISAGAGAVLCNVPGLYFLKLAACKVDCDLHTIARTHNRPFDCSPIGTQGPDRAAVEWSIMCTAVHRSCTVNHQNLCQNGTFSSSFNRPALSIVSIDTAYSDQ